MGGHEGEKYVIQSIKSFYKGSGAYERLERAVGDYLETKWGFGKWCAILSWLFNRFEDEVVKVKKFWDGG